LDVLSYNIQGRKLTASGFGKVWLKEESTIATMFFVEASSTAQTTPCSLEEIDQPQMEDEKSSSEESTTATVLLWRPLIMEQTIYTNPPLQYLASLIYSICLGVIPF
jgi:hypothetical protein